MRPDKSGCAIKNEALDESGDYKNLEGAMKTTSIWQEYNQEGGKRMGYAVP